MTIADNIGYRGLDLSFINNKLAEQRLAIRVLVNLGQLLALEQPQRILTIPSLFRTHCRVQLPLFPQGAHLHSLDYPRVQQSLLHFYSVVRSLLQKPCQQVFRYFRFSPGD